MKEDKLFAELKKYYQQLHALLIADDWAEHTKANTKTFYKEKIETLRIQCHEANPKRLKELDKRREADCPVNEPEEVS